MATRRTVVGTALALPAALAAGWFTARTKRIAAAARPLASGTSSTRCAACGASDHAMLSARCPARPRVTV